MLHRRFQLLLPRRVKGGGEPPVCSKIRALGPPSPKAAAQRPMVWGSRSKASAVAAAVQPWASSSIAYHLSRSLGVGAKIIRRRRSLVPISHCSKDRSISLTPIITPHETQRSSNPITSPIYPIPLRISPWLWFRNNRHLDCVENDPESTRLLSRRKALGQARRMDERTAQRLRQSENRILNRGARTPSTAEDGRRPWSSLPTSNPARFLAGRSDDGTPGHTPVAF